MRITLETRQSQALNRLRGMPEDAHMLFMTSGSGALEGSREEFKQLVEFIGEELAEGLVSGADARAL